jgi:hypothetical protein
MNYGLWGKPWWMPYGKGFGKPLAVYPWLWGI